MVRRERVTRHPRRAPADRRDPSSRIPEPRYGTKHRVSPKGPAQQAPEAAPSLEAEPFADAAEQILRIDAELLELIAVPLRIDLVGRT